MTRRALSVSLFREFIPHSRNQTQKSNIEFDPVLLLFKLSKGMPGTFSNQVPTGHLGKL